jgi:hypothetical protein
MGVALAMVFEVPAHAAGGPQQLALSPAIQERSLHAGTTSEQQVVLSNLTNEPLTISAYAGSFILNEKLDPKYRAMYDASTWFYIPEPEFVLQPLERRRITYSVTVPLEAEPGGHYATLYFESLIPASKSKQDAFSASPKVGMLALITVKGDIVERAEIASFKVPRVHEKGPVPIQLNLRNTGNVHLLPAGRVKIYDGRGRMITELPVDPGFTMPRTTRAYNLTWTGARFFGRYYVQAEVRYGSNSATITSKRIGLWVLPWTNIFITLLLVAAIAVLAYKTRPRWLRALRAFKASRSRGRAKSQSD